MRGTPPPPQSIFFRGTTQSSDKYKDLFHIIVIGKMFCSLCQRQLNIKTDCLFLIPAWHMFWRPNNFENLQIVFVFPFLPFRPW